MPELLKTHIHQKIKRDILTGAYDAGEQLSVNQLAERYEVSATPVREALNALEQEGLVDVIPRVGYFVSQMSLKDVQDIFQLRLIVEGAAAELAAQHITEEELLYLEQMQGHYIPGDIDSNWRYLEENREFHYRVALATRNKWLAEVVGKLLDQIQRFLFLGFDWGYHADEIMEEHPRLVVALRNRDSAAARKAMVEGLEESRKAVLEALMRTADLPIQSSR